MKLLLFIYSLAPGGAERVLVTLANYWAAQALRISVVTIAAPDSDFYRLHPSIERYSLNMAADSASQVHALWNNWNRIAALRRVLRKCEPDIALGFMTSANILLALASARHQGVVTIGAERIHPPMYPIGTPWEILRRWTYGQLDAVIALTERSGAWLAEHTTARKVHVIPNPIEWPIPTTSPVVSPDIVGRSERMRLLSVGRLDPQKGYDLLIEAFASCAPRFPQWELVIVGEGPLDSELRARIDAFGLSDRVFLAGRVGNISAWYERAHAYVMSSRFEGFPNALMEAMGHGLPVISFDCECGPRELVRHGIDGLLVPPEDANALGEAMAMLMESEALRAKLGENAVEVRRRFSLEAITREWMTVFSGLRAGS